MPASSSVFAALHLRVFFSLSKTMAKCTAIRDGDECDAMQCICISPVGSYGASIRPSIIEERVERVFVGVSAGSVSLRDLDSNGLTRKQKGF